jgi:hypothetical protein
VKDVALAEARGGTVRSVGVEEARRALGPVADALILDQIVSSRKAVRELGWNPKGREVLEELREQRG